MPLNAPQSLTDDEVYSLTAYLLSIDNIVEKTKLLDRAHLARIHMPNREGFTLLDKADFDGNLEGHH